MRTILHVCPVMQTETRAALHRLGREDVEVRAIQGGPDARRCVVDVSVSEEDRGEAAHVRHIVLGGECAIGESGTDADIEWKRSPTCFHGFSSIPELQEWLDDGAHVLVPGMLERETPIWEDWGFRSLSDAQDFVREGVSRFILLVHGVDRLAEQAARDLAADLDRPLAVRRVNETRFERRIAKALSLRSVRGAPLKHSSREPW